MRLSGIQNHRCLMKSNTRPGLKNSIARYLRRSEERSLELCPDAQPLDLGAADPPVEDQPSAEDAGEEAGMMPMTSVTAKPFTGPLPYCMRMNPG